MNRSTRRSFSCVTVLAECGETITFGMDGSAYEIDVCEAHGKELRDAYAPYVGAARRAGRPAGGQRRSSRAARTGAVNQVAQIREWARNNGHKVSERGRISATLRQAYDAAH
jgi:hypothetical protein